MRTDHSLKQNQSKPILDRPVLAAMAVAVFGVLAMLIVDHGPWNPTAVADRRGRQLQDHR
ncbi:MAG: hypothetical protein QOJ15_2967 [Bradyrhizobium sp.]|jgi:hypothetical protein|nr:hypothetical protein [Bradyrhizobium sp.]